MDKQLSIGINKKLKTTLKFKNKYLAIFFLGMFISHRELSTH